MDNTKNKIGIILLGIILLIFVVGGYFFMKYMISSPSKSHKKNNIVNDVRVNSSKDYIYFDNSSENCTLESEKSKEMKQYIVDAFTNEPFSGNPAAV